MKKIVIAACLLALAGCATSQYSHPTKPTQEELSKFQYGDTPTNYKEAIQAYIKDNLIDPDSAQFTRFSTPKKDWLSDNLLGGKTYVGWLVCVDVNAKNQYGGYVGRKPYTLILNGGKVVFAQSDETIKYVADGLKPPQKHPIECDYSGT